MNPLRVHLTETGSTALEFAPHVGVSFSHLCRLMRGEREADATMLAAIEDATDGAVSAAAWLEWWRGVTSARQQEKQQEKQQENSEG